ELRPLVNAAFQRHSIAQINDNRRLRNVEKQNREQPKKEMRLAELGGGADPGRADHEQNLGENEIEKTERLLERFALRFDILLCALELRRHNDTMSILRFVLGLGRRRRHVAKFTVPNFPA